MKIIMPLFNFECEEISNFKFGETGISIEQFHEEHIINTPLFLEYDIFNMKQVGFALNCEFDNDYRKRINILLLTFKIFSENRYPYIK